MHRDEETLPLTPAMCALLAADTANLRRLLRRFWWIPLVGAGLWTLVVRSDKHASARDMLLVAALGLAIYAVLFGIIPLAVAVQGRRERRAGVYVRHIGGFQVGTWRSGKTGRAIVLILPRGGEMFLAQGLTAATVAALYATRTGTVLYIPVSRRALVVWDDAGQRLYQAHGYDVAADPTVAAPVVAAAAATAAAAHPQSAR